MRTFPEYLRECRAAAGKMQRDLAAAIGVDVPMYSRYEHGERRPKREQVVKLARLLKVDADELVALWLAQGAHDDIANDKLAGRAAQMLGEMLMVSVADSGPAASVSPVAAEEVAQEIAPVTRDLVGRVRRAGRMPYYIVGDAVKTMNTIEDGSIDCLVTTAPYWGMRDHGKEGIAATMSVDEYVKMLLSMTGQARRVLKPQGSLWLHIADAAADGALQGIPERVVSAMVTEQGWNLRATVVWRKTRGVEDGDEHLRRVHEVVYHLTPSGDYYFDDAALRQVYNDSGSAGQSGSTRSGVTGTRYLQRIRQSTQLTDSEKAAAEHALRVTIARVEAGEINDYRMFLREESAVVDNQSERAQAIAAQGYYIIESNRLGAAPPDVWTIEPERSPIDHYHVTPSELYRLAIISTCPADGVVLDPYCGTGTACVVAYNEGRRSIGIDVNGDYVHRARRRVEQKPLSLFD